MCKESRKGKGDSRPSAIPGFIIAEIAKASGKSVETIQRDIHTYEAKFKQDLTPLPILEIITDRRIKTLPYICNAYKVDPSENTVVDVCFE